MATTATTEWWQEQHYLAGKPIGAGLWICLAPMITTYRLMICDPGFVHEFFCYPHHLGFGRAQQAFNEWDGHGDPIDGWVKHFPSGRRNPPDPFGEVT